MIQQFTSGYLCKQNENTNFIYTHLHVHCSVIYSGQIWKQTKCPSMDRWIKEIWYIYAHIVEYHTTIKRTKSCHLQQYG